MIYTNPLYYVIKTKPVNTQYDENNRYYLVTTVFGIRFSFRFLGKLYFLDFNLQSFSVILRCFTNEKRDS